MTRSFTRELGHHQVLGKSVFLYLEVEHSFDDPQDFVIEIYFRELDHTTLNEKKVPVARIDSRSHGSVHLDKLFAENQGKIFRSWSFFEAWEKIQQEWEEYTTKYVRNHGR